MFRRAVCTAVLSSVLLGLTVASGSAADNGPPVTLPKDPKGLKAPVTLPKDLDPVPMYQPQVACQPGETPGLKKLRDLVLKTYKIGYTGSTARTCTEGTSEHADGRAWDWMVAVKTKKEKAAAADFLAWLTQDGGRNARRLGVMYVIYNKKIWGAYRASDGWRPSYDHVDHVHVSFSWNGARAKTSFWTGKVQPTDFGPCAVFSGEPGQTRSTANPTRCRDTVALPKRSSYPTSELGSKVSSVETGQQLVGAKTTGTFDAATRTAVYAWQKAHDAPLTGTLDQATWVSLAPSKVKSDATSGMTKDEARAYGLAHYSGTTLRQGSAGKAVLVLQKAIGRGLAYRTGYFGASLESAVKDAQEKIGRPQTGTWTEADWVAITD